jgi:hypothetical protein
MLDILNPVKAVQSLILVVKDISNYLFYRKKIKKINEEGFFKERNIRVDSLNRVYYVVNLEPELQLATGDIIDLEKSRVYDSVSKIQSVFANNNLIEIVNVSSKRIKSEDYYAYLVTISYRKNFEWKDVFRILILGVASYYLIHFGIWLGENWDSVTGYVSNKLNSK